MFVCLQSITDAQVRIKSLRMECLLPVFDLLDTGSFCQNLNTSFVFLIYILTSKSLVMLANEIFTFYWQKKVNKSNL